MNRISLLLLGIALLSACKHGNESPSVERPRVSVFCSEEIQDSLDLFMDAVDSCDVFSVWIEKEDADTIVYFIAFEAIYPEPVWRSDEFRPVGAIETEEGDIIALAYVNIDGADMIADEFLFNMVTYNKNTCDPYNPYDRRLPFEFILPSQRVYKVRNGTTLELISIQKRE